MHINTVLSLVKLFSRSASSEMAQRVTGVERVSEGCGRQFLTVGQGLRWAGEDGRAHAVKQGGQEAGLGVFMSACRQVTCSWKVKVAQLCPALCNPMDYTVHGILQARVLEWVAFPFSRGPSQPRD